MLGLRGTAYRGPQPGVLGGRQPSAVNAGGGFLEVPFDPAHGCGNRDDRPDDKAEFVVPRIDAGIADIERPPSRIQTPVDDEGMTEKIAWPAAEIDKVPLSFRPPFA